MNEFYIKLIAVVFFISLIILFTVFRKKKSDNRKKIKSLTISNINSIEIGHLVKVKGTLIKIKLIQSNLTKTQCIGYDYKAMQRVVKDPFDNNHSSKRWETIDSIEECYDFYIKDNTGKVKVEAEDISIICSSNEKTIIKNKISYFENLLLPNKEEYFVIGTVVKDENELIIVKDVYEKELSIFDMKAYDLIVNTSQWYKVGCSVFLLLTLVLFLAMFFQ